MPPRARHSAELTETRATPEVRDYGGPCEYMAL
jgi:hypothetical protein